eukprot:Pgem_evm1s6929
MTIDNEHLGIPDTNYTCQVTMSSAEFQRICRDLSSFGDSVLITCSKEGVTFTTNGDSGSGSIALRANSEAEKDYENVIIDMQDSVELNFALNFLSMFTKATPLSPKVILHLIPEAPLLVEYKIEKI